MANAPFGVRIDHLGRYKLPLLPGERGPKAGGDWVPRGVQSATNLAGAIVESRQLGIWERRLSQIGLAVRPPLAEHLATVVHRARAQGVDFLKLTGDDAQAEAKVLAAALDEIHFSAKDAAGGNDAMRAGTIRHDVWEERGKTSQLFGTPEISRQISSLETLLAARGLERVPGLQERTVRNVGLRAAGRFDDVLRVTRHLTFPNPADDPVPYEVIPAGTLLMADLKTKRRKFYTWMEVRIQLTVYATAEYMLHAAPARYVPGPVHHVDQNWGVVLHMPSDGGQPQLRRVNLVKGYQHALLARAVVDARSEAKNVAADGESLWPES